ncbi:MAG: MGMT family protein [Rhodothermia bacterium]|nr:MAG: MGMT family protein [Rhodothermia bacterium]
MMTSDTSYKVNSEIQQKSDFYSRVWEVVERIPLGRVTTYGLIAEHLGARRSARMVGWALNAAAGFPIPCHRVVNRFGGLSGSLHFGGPFVMEDLLRNEGIEFDSDGCVLMDRFLWTPEK